MEESSLNSTAETSTSSLEDKYRNLSKEQLLELLLAFQSLIKTPEGQQLFVQKINQSNNTLIQRRTNSMPYYREKFARELKVTIDAMLEDKKNRIYLYKNFKTISHNSLYLRIHQSFLFLIDNLDEGPEYKYAKARESITISKRSDGILLELVDSLGQPDTISREDTKQVKEKPSDSSVILKDRKSWKELVDNFISNGEINSRLVINDIWLNEEDIEIANSMFLGLEDQFIYKIRKESIVIIRIDPLHPPQL